MASHPPQAADTPAAQDAHALALGMRLAEFEIRGVLGVGGFGIVYRAWDRALERQVALKEYMPAALAARTHGLRVAPRSPADGETFALGLRSFVNEARMLARFDHPSLVKVYRFWEDHGTAYMAMPCYQGRTLREVRRTMERGPDEAACLRLLVPLLGALELLHAQGVYHRDIAPDNILVCEDGTPVLLDFGAARRIVNDRTQALTAILKPSFAPLEQYADVAAMRQGPWTDLYSLGATMYFLLTGRAPLPAAARALRDELQPLAQLRPPGCSPGFLQALDWALALRPADRPESAVVLRDVLEGRMAVPQTARRDITAPGVTARSVAAEGWSPQALARTVSQPRKAAAGEPPRRPAAAAGPSPPPGGAGAGAAAAPSVPPGSGAPVRRPAAPADLPAARTDGAAGTARAQPRRRAGRGSLGWAGLAAAGVVAGGLLLPWGVSPPPRQADAGPAAAAAAPPATANPLPGRRGSAPPAEDHGAGHGEAQHTSPPPDDPVGSRGGDAAAASARERTPKSAVEPEAQPPARGVQRTAAPAPPPDPRARCPQSMFLLLRLECVRRECERPEVAPHPECRRMRELEPSGRRSHDLP